MKCVSCETEINPKWGHAIEQNVCPFCGKSIMEEHLKNCLTSLATSMAAMLKYPEQLDDWLLSNHSYIKTDSPNLKHYLPKEMLKEMRKEADDAEFQDKKPHIVKLKVPDGQGGIIEQDVIVEKTQSEEKTKSFFDRAEALQGSGKTSGKSPRSLDEPEVPKSIAEKTKNLKSIAQQIKRQASSGITSQDSLAAMMEQADPEAIAEFQSVINSGDIISSGLPDPAQGDDDEIPAVVSAMARMAGGNNSTGANEKDLRALQEMQNKAANAQKRLSSGKGSFGRSS